MFKDKDLACKDCGCTFTFTAREQEFYAEKGFQNEPARCPECRRARKQQTGGGGGQRREREMHDVICSGCGCETQVPFRPTSDKPVYCNDCFRGRR